MSYSFGLVHRYLHGMAKEQSIWVKLVANLIVRCDDLDDAKSKLFGRSRSPFPFQRQIFHPRLLFPVPCSVIIGENDRKLSTSWGCRQYSFTRRRLVVGSLRVGVRLTIKRWHAAWAKENDNTDKSRIAPGAGWFLGCPSPKACTCFPIFVGALFSWLSFTPEFLPSRESGPFFFSSVK